MSCKKGDTYELFFKYIHKSHLLKKWGGNYIYMKQISSWQVFNFLLYRQSSILQIFYFIYGIWQFVSKLIEYMCLNAGKLRAWIRVWEKLHHCQRAKKVMNMACHFTHRWKWKLFKGSLQHLRPVSHTICPNWSRFCLLRFFFFSTTCSKVISTFKQ